MSYYVYVLSSTLKKWNYVGFTSNLDARIVQHNSGTVRSTKSYMPFVLIYAHIVKDRIEARDLEKYLKINWNKESLLKLLAG